MTEIVCGLAQNKQNANKLITLNIQELKGQSKVVGHFLRDCFKLEKEGNKRRLMPLIEEFKKEPYNCS
jgi:uncharacterized protein YdeI (YjbR/CyaY-like superfamily)